MRKSLSQEPVDQQPSAFTTFHGLAYLLPGASVYFLFGPLFIVQGIYAKDFGLSLTAIATAIFISRVFDAVTDPVMGYLSDRYYASMGGRKLLVALGSVLLILSSIFLYVPKGDVTWGYFLFWLICFYTSYTIFEIPYVAWGNELAHSSKEKNKVYAFRAGGLFIGSLIFYAIPLMSELGAGAYTPATLKTAVWIVSIFAVPMLLFCMIKLPRGHRHRQDNGLHKVSSDKSNSAKRSPNTPIPILIRSMLQNRPFKIFTIAYVLTGIGSGMALSLLFLYADVFLKSGSDLPLIYVGAFSVSVIALKFWYYWSRRVEKQTVWMFGMFMVVLGLLGLGLMTPSNSNSLDIAICVGLIFCGFSAFQIIVPSLLGDIVDYGTRQSGRYDGGSYFSSYTLINKGAAAAGSAIGFAIAGWLGFDASADTQGYLGQLGIRISTAWLPAAIIAASVFAIRTIPITANEHARIIHQLSIGERE